MTTEKKRYVVQIHGKEYVLISDDSESHVKASATMVDELIRSIDYKVTNAEFEKVVILAAVRLASDLLKVNMRVEDITTRHDALSKQIAEELF